MYQGVQHRLDFDGPSGTQLVYISGLAPFRDQAVSAGDIADIAQVSFGAQVTDTHNRFLPARLDHCHLSGERRHHKRIDLPWTGMIESSRDTYRQPDRVLCFGVKVP